MFNYVKLRRTLWKDIQSQIVCQKKKKHCHWFYFVYSLYLLWALYSFQMISIWKVD